MLALYIFSCAVWLPGRGAGGRVDLEKPFKFMGFCGGICMCAFLRAASKTRKSLPKSNENQTKKQRKTNTRATHKNTRKTSKNRRKIAQNGSPEGVLRGPGGSWPQVRRQEPPKISFGGFPAPQKIVGGRPGGAKRKFGDLFHPPSKPTPTRAPRFWSIFL